MLAFKRAWELLGGEEAACAWARAAPGAQRWLMPKKTPTARAPGAGVAGSVMGGPGKGGFTPTRCGPGDAGGRCEPRPGGKQSSGVSPAPSACRINTGVCYRDTRGSVLKDNINKLGRAVSRLRRGLASRRSLRWGDHDQ